MELFCVTKNTGPSWSSDPLHLIYLGTSLDDAIATIDAFARYEVNVDRFMFDRVYPDMFTILPEKVAREFVKMYMADGWWMSIVKMTFGEEKKEDHPKAVVIWELANGETGECDENQAITETLRAMLAHDPGTIAITYPVGYTVKYHLK